MSGTGGSEGGAGMRAFRFGAVVAPDDEVKRWRDTVHRVADLGYSTVLMPDGLQLHAPFPSLAVAAEVEPRVRVGTFVLAGPLRQPRMVAWEAHTLSLLSGGRFDLGLGTGRPAVREWTEAMGLPFGSAEERLDQLATTVDELRALDGDQHTPVLVAASGPKALAVAGARADAVTLAAGPLATRAEVAAMAARVRDAAGERDVELAMNVFVVGDEVAPWVRDFVGVDAETLIAHDSLYLLRGTTDDMVAELQRRRDAFGVSAVSVHWTSMEALAPVVQALTGR